jgi:hypothetical protein
MRPDEPFEVLQGGVANAGAVIRRGNTVERPASAHARAIHVLLRHLRSNGFAGVPDPVGPPANGREWLRFIEGDVAIPPFPNWCQSDPALISVFELLRRYHDACIGFTPPDGATWSEEMADPNPGDNAVMAHSDLCLENIVFLDGQATAFLDFDFVAPGRRTWDIASTARYVVPIDDPTNATRNGHNRLDPARRLRLALDSYGLATASERLEVIEILQLQVESGGEFVRRRVEAGEQPFIEMWNRMGGQERFDRRREWFATVRSALEATCA